MAMNIVVCVKYVPDATADRSFNDSDSTVDRVGVDGLLSELDENAIEEALKIVEAHEGEVTVLTVGPVKAQIEEKRTIPLSPLLGGISLAGGIALLIAGTRPLRPA